jgi:hypothetical protein
MLKHTLLLGAALLPATFGFAQTNQNCGFLFHVAVGATSRGPALGDACELLARFGFDDYRAYGRPQAAGATITGFFAMVQDQDGSTQESFDVHVYAQDPANTAFPNFPAGSTPGTNALISVPLSGPTSSSGAVASTYTVNFATPLVIPNHTGNVFLGVSVPAANWPSDGLSLQLNSGVPLGAGFSIYDLPGEALIDQNSYAAVHVVGNSYIAYGLPGQWGVDLRTDYVSGVVTAITNQTSYTVSNAAPGTASFLSGLHPDASSPAYNSGRADDIAYVFTDPTMVAGALVFETLDFGFAAVPQPLSNFAPGAQGYLCQSLNLMSVALQTATGPTVSFVTTIPASARSLLGSTIGKLIWSAVSLDASGNIKGGPCGASHF